MPPLTPSSFQPRKRRFSSPTAQNDWERDSDFPSGSSNVYFSDAPRSDSHHPSRLARLSMFQESSEPPLAYSSLPPTPLAHDVTPPDSPVSPLSPVMLSHTSAPPFSLYDYLQEEILATDFDSHQELKWERVSNWLAVPPALEKLLGFGFLLCFDSFLFCFTILPIRFFLAMYRLAKNTLLRSPGRLPPSQKADLLRALLCVVSITILIPLTDASKIYHTIRGQETIKLYVIFNALEIADRLCAAIGQDILDCLFSRSILEPLSTRRPLTPNTFRPMGYFVLATIYVVTHTLVMVYQLISLNVAINSYDNALLSLLISNQFVEIKGSVFKKFEKDNLFQIACADIVERFTLALMLCVIAFRNLIELTLAEIDSQEGLVLPKSFGWFKGNNILWTISYPVLLVIVSEMLVDWLKHAFITKFNHVRVSVYGRYMDVLCQDLASGSAVGRHARKHNYVDQSPLVARRLGFAAIPLAVLSVLIGAQSLALLFHTGTESFEWSISSLYQSDILHYFEWAILGVLFWICVVVIKIIIGVHLLSFATRRRVGMEQRAKEDTINDFGRDPIGEGKEEQQYNQELKHVLDNAEDDLTPVAEIGERPTGSEGKKGRKGKKKERVPLEDLTRYTMIKRIF